MSQWSFLKVGCVLTYLLYSCLLIFPASKTFAMTLVLPENGNVVGHIKYTHASPGDMLADIAIRYDIGLKQLINANPTIDPRHLLSSSVRVLIPSQFILPNGPRQGIVINLAEYRLYFFPENDNVVMTHPIGIGRKGWETPTGVTTIVKKERNPVWRPTANLIAASEKRGVMIPEEFPGGASNPLGHYAFRLGWPTYLIHGTPRMDGIGERVSAGCIRMLAKDIEYLFDEVPIGTRVRVQNDSVKLGFLGHSIFVEIHPVLAGHPRRNLQTQISQVLAKRGLIQIKNRPIVLKEMQHPSGVPLKIA